MTDVDMSEPVSAAAGKSERTRKPSTTVSTRSTRRTASPSRSSKQDDAGPPTPESPPFRLTRKRAASLAADHKGDDDGSNHSSSRDEADVAEAITPDSTTNSRMSSGGASAASAGSSAASHVCLCQPDPKIPRPRNAFILYRQHHQAAIVAQHPGLANPDISKIIGEQWKAQPESVRNEWKALAEEEKLRHQQQYPDYRYQPRRGGRRGSVSSTNISNNTVPDKHICNKCGGRSITTTPTTPFTTAAANAGAPSSLSTPMLPPPTPSSALTPTSRYLPPMMSNLAINTAQAQAQAQAARRNTRPTPGPLSNVHAARSRDDLAELQMLSPLSPDAKRRRFNQTYVPPNARAGSSGAGTPGTPYPFPTDLRRQSLPRPDMLRGPSPRGSHAPHSAGGHHHHHNNNNHHHDSNLTLPPLQTPTTTAGSPRSASDPQSRSVEAMVMSMPFWGKIRVLGKIAPPYRPSAPPPKVRGAIVAVEGDDSGAVRAMAAWLEERLNKTGETYTRVAKAPMGPPAPATPNASAGGVGDKVGLGDYINVIAEWHSRTVEMVDFITTAPSASTSTEDKSRRDSSTSSGSATPTPPKQDNDDDAATGTNKDAAADARTPVLIMPTYNLRAADAWASRIPITDNYSPADHWQWVATLWRGIVGPDITVYIKDVAASELELTGGKAVEVREDGQTKCLIVKRVNAKEIEESALRRLGFEVGELIRGVGSVSGK